MASEIPCPQAAMKYSVIFFKALLIVYRWRRLATTSVSFFGFAFGNRGFPLRLTDQPVATVWKFLPTGRRCFFLRRLCTVNHSQADAWLCSSSACTLVFFIKGQSLIITPPDYYCFYKMMDSPKRQFQIWNVLFLPSLLVLLLGDEGFIHMRLLLPSSQ